MKHFGKKVLRITGMVVLGILLILAGLLYWIWPVYPSDEKEVKSFSEFCEILSENDGTKDYIIIDPKDYGAEPKSLFLFMNGSTRDADPIGYCLVCDNPKGELFDSLWVNARQYPINPFQGTAYRNAEVMLKDGTYPTGDRYTELTLLNDKCYVICALYNPAGLSEQKITERDEDLRELVYAVADKIIDGTAKG